jgi:hypothetical protein
MDMTGEQRLPAGRARVWAALNDPEVLKQCIPGCESIELTPEGEMLAKVVAKVGPVKATFSGKVRFENVVPETSYSIVGEGQGGVAGFAKGGADVTLADDEGGGTLMTYVVKAQIGGKLAQLGARLIDSTAKSMAEQFFAKFAEIVAEGAAPSAPPAGEAAAAPTAPPAVPPPARATPAAVPSALPSRPPGLPVWGWVGAIILLALAGYAALR